MVKMSVRIDLVEDEEGRVKSRVAVGVDANAPNFAVVDHMLRKMDQTFIQAKAQLVEQCKLQDLTPQPAAPF